MTISKQLLKEYLTTRIEELQIEAEESLGKDNTYYYIKGGIDELKVLAIILDTNTFKEGDSPDQK